MHKTPGTTDAGPLQEPGATQAPTVPTVMQAQLIRRVQGEPDAAANAASGPPDDRLLPDMF